MQAAEAVVCTKYRPHWHEEGGRETIGLGIHLQEAGTRC